MNRISINANTAFVEEYGEERVVAEIEAAKRFYEIDTLEGNFEDCYNADISIKTKSGDIIEFSCSGDGSDAKYSLEVTDALGHEIESAQSNYEDVVIEDGYETLIEAIMTRYNILISE